MSETYDQQMKDSDMIFTQISTSSINNYADAERLMIIYITDLSISRAGISHAIKRLKEFYDKRENETTQTISQ